MISFIAEKKRMRKGARCGSISPARVSDTNYTPRDTSASSQASPEYGRSSEKRKAEKLGAFVTEKLACR